MNDSRPRNNRGQFAPEVQGELDANNTSAAYNPQIIENRKATLGEKLRRAIGLRGGVEGSVPERVFSRFNHGEHGEHGAKLKELAGLRWENSPDFNSSKGDSALGRAGSLVAAAGAGVAANAAGVLGAKKIINIKPSPETRWERSYNNRVLDKFASKKGYVPANHSDVGISEKSMPAAVLQFKQPIRGKKGIFLRGKNTPDFVRAHEAGHVAQNLTSKRGLFGLAGQQTASKYAPLGLLSAVVNKDKKYDNVATGMAAAGTLASLPTMHNEIDASARGYKIMRKLGSSRLRAAGAFIGVPTYGAVAALPAMGWGARKLRQAKAEKSKQLSAKLRLRELARQAAYDPYATQAQPAERGQAGKDFRNAAIGIGALGAGGGVAYAGWSGAQAAKSAQTLTDDALKTSGEARKAARAARVTAARLNRVGKTIKTQLTTFPTFKKVASKFFEEDLQNLRGLATISDRLIEFVVVDPGHVVPGLWAKISGKAKFDAAKNAASLAKDYRAWPKSAFGGKSREYAREQIARGRKLANQGKIQRAASIAGAGGLAAAGAAALVPSKKEFAEKERSGLQKAGIAAGVGAAAVGASFMPAATKLWRIQAREAAKKAQSAISKSKGMKNIIKSPLDDPNRGGKIVADYLDASQLAMNRGLHGKVIGKVLQHAKANPGGRVSKTIGGDFGVSHYARFRAGPKEALGHWDWELGESNALKGKGRGPDWLTKRQDNIARGRDSAHAEINNRLWNHGENEGEAIRHVGTNSQSKDTREYFDLLAAHKAGAAKMYAKKALIAPGLIVAGGATAAASSRNQKK